MIAEPMAPERLSEILRLSTDLSDRALDALITDGAVPAGQAIALAKAARLLQDLDVDWPPLMTYVMHEMADKSGRLELEPAAELQGDDGLTGLSRFFASFRKDKDQQ